MGSEHESLEALLSGLAQTLRGPRFGEKERAELYVYGKREGRLRDESALLMETPLGVNRVVREFRLTSQHVSDWEGRLVTAGLRDDEATAPLMVTGRVDLAVLSPDGSALNLTEFKVWSSGDAVERRRYEDACAKNHSITKNFETDALKILSIPAAEGARRWIVTALFTIHCDGLTGAQMKMRRFAYVPLLLKQNLDKAGIGGSDNYRSIALEMMMEGLTKSFDRTTEATCRLVHVKGFDSSLAGIDGVGVSLDLIGAELNQS